MALVGSYEDEEGVLSFLLLMRCSHGKADSTFFAVVEEEVISLLYVIEMRDERGRKRKNVN